MSSKRAMKQAQKLAFQKHKLNTGKNKFTIKGNKFSKKKKIKFSKKKIKYYISSFKSVLGELWVIFPIDILSTPVKAIFFIFLIFTLPEASVS